MGGRALGTPWQAIALFGGLVLATGIAYAVLSPRSSAFWIGPVLGALAFGLLVDVRNGGSRAVRTFSDYLAAGWLLPAGAPLSPDGANTRAVSRRPGEDHVYQCQVYRSRRGGPSSSLVSLDYSGPDLANATAYPGHRLSEQVKADTCIAGDLAQAPEEANHGVVDPENDFNALHSDGSVGWISPGSPATSATRPRPRACARSRGVQQGGHGRGDGKPLQSLRESAKLLSLRPETAASAAGPAMNQRGVATCLPTCN